MLLGQLLVMVVAAVKRFDAVVLHAWESAREKCCGRLRGMDWLDGEAGLGIQVFTRRG